MNINSISYFVTIVNLKKYKITILSRFTGNDDRRNNISNDS